MAIEITNNTILKQCSSSPPHPLSETIVPLTVFDLAAMDLHVPTLYAFRAPMPSNEDLKDGLAKVLVNYPHLSGRMICDTDGKQCFNLNNAGVRFIETIVGSSLYDKLPLEAATTDLAKLHPLVEGVEELLQVQLNRYTCGGLVIGVTSHHRVADGQSMSQFLVAWSETVRNSTTTSPLPFHDRSSIIVPRNPPFCNFKHQEFESKPEEKTTKYSSDSSIVSFVVRYSSNFIATLKSKVPERSSTFECLLAHLWKKITIARELHEDEHTKIRIAVNGRARMNPRIPMEFFGNLVLWANPSAQVGKLVHSSHARVVKMLRDEVRRIDDGYFKSFIDHGELMKGGYQKMEESAPESGSVLCPNLEVDSWLRFNFHDLDFGSGGPCSFLPPNLPVEGLMVFVPSCKEKGGVDVFMALFEEHVDVFNKICYDLD